MRKRHAKTQKDWTTMYVYNASLYEDLISKVTEFLGEAEHMGMHASMRELSSDTVHDMKAWCEKRKELLLNDFLAYYSELSRANLARIREIVVSLKGPDADYPTVEEALKEIESLTTE